MNVASSHNLVEINFCEAEEAFMRLLRQDDLDRHVNDFPESLEPFEDALDLAMVRAYRDEAVSPNAHLFLQRILYRINRLKLFWYDDLENYTNENSAFLFSLRTKIETAWQDWEAQNIHNSSLKVLDVKTALRERTANDLDP